MTAASRVISSRKLRLEINVTSAHLPTPQGTAQTREHDQAMESLGQLNTALPPNELAEQALASSFRQAALSITALFKQGKRATTKGMLVLCHLVHSRAVGQASEAWVR